MKGRHEIVQAPERRYLAELFEPYFIAGAGSGESSCGTTRMWQTERGEGRPATRDERFCPIWLALCTIPFRRPNIVRTGSRHCPWTLSQSRALHRHDRCRAAEHGLCTPIPIRARPRGEDTSAISSHLPSKCTEPRAAPMSASEPLPTPPPAPFNPNQKVDAATRTVHCALPPPRSPRGALLRRRDTDVPTHAGGMYAHAAHAEPAE
jgi:hypothetical protein